jgi:hypothetical protein
MSGCHHEPTYEPLTAIDSSKPPCTDFSKPLQGRWFDDGNLSKRVTFTECPLISSAYACTHLGTSHATTAARLRFSPETCSLAPFCARTFLGWLGGHKLVLTGDSHGRQAFGSLACKLFKAGRVRQIRGPCAATTASCAAAGQYAQDRRLCGDARCTFGNDAPPAARQSGPRPATKLGSVGTR